MSALDAACLLMTQTHSQLKHCEGFRCLPENPAEVGCGTLYAPAAAARALLWALRGLCRMEAMPGLAASASSSSTAKAFSPLLRLGLLPGRLAFLPSLMSRGFSAVPARVAWRWPVQHLSISHPRQGATTYSLFVSTCSVTGVPCMRCCKT